MDKFTNKVACFLATIGNAYKEEEEREYFAELELTEEELTEDFTAMLVALHVLYREITEDDTDLVGFTHVLNRLAVQHCMEKKEQAEEALKEMEG